MAVLAACEKENRVSLVYGEWKLESWYGQPTGGDVPTDVYLSFSTDGSFEIFQKLGDAGHYSAFTGTYGITGDGALYGIYSDGKSWAGNYDFSVDGDRLTLENTDEAVQGACIYVRTTIPASVRKDADDYGTTKASDEAETAATCRL